MPASNIAENNTQAPPSPKAADTFKSKYGGCKPNWKAKARRAEYNFWGPVSFRPNSSGDPNHDWQIRSLSEASPLPASQKNPQLGQAQRVKPRQPAQTIEVSPDTLTTIETDDAASELTTPARSAAKSTSDSPENYASLNKAVTEYLAKQGLFHAGETPPQPHNTPPPPKKGYQQIATAA